VSRGRNQDNKMRYTIEVTKFDSRHNLTKRSAHIWNSLSNKAIQAENMNKFKAEIDLAMNDLE